jgi:ATP-dependent Lon protease
LKLLHPADDPPKEQIYEYLEYAIEGRRRVKEQLNKRKPDDEFAYINLGYLRNGGDPVTVYCPESKDAAATQTPDRSQVTDERKDAKSPVVTGKGVEASAPAAVTPTAVEETEPALFEPRREPKERHYRIHYGATGYSFESIFGDYLPGADEIVVEDPYIRHQHQIVNFLRFCETAVRVGKPKKIVLRTRFDDGLEKEEAMAKLLIIADSLKQFDVAMEIKENPNLHDREIRLSNGWSIKIGRGFDIYQRPDDWLQVGANDLDLRPCLETNVDVVRTDI